MNEVNKPPMNYGYADRVAESSLGPPIVWDGALGFLKRRRRTILATMVAVFAIGFVALLLAPSNFKATAVASINANPAIPENPQMQSLPPPSERMQREIQGLQSRALAAMVIVKLKLDLESEFNPDLHGPGLLERLGRHVAIIGAGSRDTGKPSVAEARELRLSAAVDLFMQKLSVTPVLTADLIQITFTSRNPRVAYRVANSIVETYIEAAASQRGSALQKAADALQERIAAVRDELRDLPVGAGAVSTIERQLEARRILLQTYIAKLGELLLLKAAIEPRVIIQSRAVYPMRRAGLPLALGIPLVLAVGLTLGIGLGIVQEVRQKTVSNPQQLRSLFGLQILGRANRSDSAISPTGKDLEEACNGIARELTMEHLSESSVTVLVTGASQSAASSSVAATVARALARTDQRTLLVSADTVSSSRATKRRGEATPTGAAASEAQPEDARPYSLRRDEAIGLDQLVVDLDGSPSAAAFEGTANTIAEMSARYRFVILDLPTITSSPAARLLGHFSHLAVLVVRRDHDTHDALRSAIDRLNGDGVRIIGAVLTKGKFARGSRSRAADNLRSST